MSKSQALQKLAHKSRGFIENVGKRVSTDVIFSRVKNMFLYEIIKF